MISSHFETTISKRDNCQSHGSRLNEYILGNPVDFGNLRKKHLIGTWIATVFCSRRVSVPKRSNPIRLRASRRLFSTDHYTKRDLRTDLSAVSRLFFAPFEKFSFPIPSHWTSVIVYFWAYLHNAKGSSSRLARSNFLDYVSALLDKAILQR